MFSTIPVYSRDQLNIAQWDKCKIFVNNSLQFLNKNANYIVAAVIPAIVMFKLFPRMTLKEQREQAQNLISAFNEGSLFSQIPNVRAEAVIESFRIMKLDDEQLQKQITREPWLASFGLGFLGFMLYFSYKNSNSLDYSTPNYLKQELTKQELAKICYLLAFKINLIKNIKKLQDVYTSKVEDEEGAC